LVDVRTLRSSPLVTRIDDVLEPIMDERSRDLRALLDRVDEVAIAYHHGRMEGGDEALVVVGRGSFTEHDLGTLGRDHTSGAHREHALRHDDGMSLALAGDHTLAFGSEALVLAVLDRLDGLAPATGPTRPAVLDAARRVELGQHTVTYAAEVSETFRADLSANLSARGAALSVGGRLDLGSSLVAHGFGLFSEPDMAREVVAQILAKLAEGAGEPQAAEMGMLDIINALDVRADGAVVLADITLDHDTLERIVSVVLLGVQASVSLSEQVVGEQADDQVFPEPAPVEEPQP
jgi:hypothetical protein